MLPKPAALHHHSAKEDYLKMKKWVALVLVMSVVLTVLSAFAIAPVTEPRTVYVNTKDGRKLNLREAPNKNAKSLAKLARGEEFWVTEAYSDGWCYGCKGGPLGGLYGYVMTQFLSDSKPAPAPRPDPEDDTKKQQELLNRELKSEREVAEQFFIVARPSRVSGWVNFRVGPSTITSRITSLPDGKELIVVGETDNWYRAKDPETGRTGYIHKNYTERIAKQIANETTEGNQKLGRLEVNGEFDLTCKLPADYSLSVVNMRGDKIIASVLSDDVTKPQMYLTVAYDETYGDIERMNDMSDEDLAVLEGTFKEMNHVSISYAETGHGTKIMIAREEGDDDDFVDILAIYKGYFIEFNMSPNANCANKTLTDDQVKMCIDFLTDLDFIPVEKQ